MTIKEAIGSYGKNKLNFEHVWCPPRKCPDRGAPAYESLLDNNSQSYVLAEHCKECEYKMYHVMGITCPQDLPPHRKE